LSLASAGSERPAASVPRWIIALLATSLAAQIAWQATRGAPRATASDLPPQPPPQALAAASFGERAAVARLAMLWLQAFDSGGGNILPYRQLDYSRLIEWLRAILATDLRSGYPLFAAARIYAEVEDPAKARRMYEFLYVEYLKDPNRRWAPLAHAALLAKHRLHDLPLARRYAAAIARHTTDESAPLWAKQMEIFILEDMNELEAAKVMLGGLLATGRIDDPGERRFLEGRLEELERRIARSGGKEKS
jgi:hypothetical protein